MVTFNTPGPCGVIPPPAEYFLAENRRPEGFDIHLPGAGLLIWHAENSIAYGLFGNSGGFTDIQARGLVVIDHKNRSLALHINLIHGSQPFRGCFSLLKPETESRTWRLFPASPPPSTIHCDPG